MTGLHPLQAGYAGLFAAATAACLAGLVRVRELPDEEIRRGLAWLLVLSAAWAALVATRLLVTGVAVQRSIYVAGLVVGLGTVLAWLYFASAYAGRGLHRDPRLRRVAAGSYLAIVSVKLTNPIHGGYFSVRPLDQPFPHLAIRQEPIHWVVMGLAYAGAAVGFYLLYDTFAASRRRTRRLTLLALVTLLPVVADVVALTRPAVPEVNFEAVGVGVFAVGVLFLVEEDFVRARLTARRALLDDLPDPALVVDASGRLLDYNDAVADLLGDLEAGGALAEQAPVLAAALDGDVTDLSLGDRTFLVRQRAVAGGGGTATTVVLREVTEYERQRREIARQNEQLQAIADAVAHNLRNASNVLLGHVDRAERSLSGVGPSGGGPGGGGPDGGGSPAGGDTGGDGPVGGGAARADEARESLAVARRTADRIAATAEDLRLLAEYGQTVTATRPTAVGEVAREAWADCDTGGATLHCDDAPTVEADPTRLLFLLRAAFRFHLANGASAVAVETCDEPDDHDTGHRAVAGRDTEAASGPDGTAATTDGTGDPAGFVVAGDGPPVTVEQEALLAFDTEAATETPGLGLPVARALAEAQGWRLTLDADAEGPRLCVRTRAE